MNLHPFPSRTNSVRNELPPPVPPKRSFSTSLPHISDCVAPLNSTTTTTTNMTLTKRLIRKVSLENSMNLRSRPRSPTKYPNSERPPSPPEKPVPASDPINPSTSPKLSLASAKQKAKVVWAGRRKGSSPDIDTSIAAHEQCMDSPTIPGRPAIVQERQPSANGWRGCVFGEALVSSITPPQDFLPAYDMTERPVSPSHLPPTPSTPWPTPDEDVRPQVPPKIAPAIQKAGHIHRLRADSAPTKTPGNTVAKSHLQVEITRPSSADSMLAPLQQKPKDMGCQHQKRKKSSASPTLPHCIRQSRAITHISQQTIQSLQKTTRMHPAKIDVLTHNDVERLANELSQLEIRCQYLREMHKSLRVGRRALHARLLTYLRSAHSAMFSREGLLKQEEALAELDAAIDDWQAKLEKAEKRKTQVRVVLLEHIAFCACSPQVPRPATPPTTPGKKKRPRHDQESITVYALLADIEQKTNRVARI